METEIKYGPGFHSGLVYTMDSCYVWVTMLRILESHGSILPEASFPSSIHSVKCTIKCVFEKPRLLGVNEQPKHLKLTYVKSQCAVYWLAKQSINQQSSH